MSAYTIKESCSCGASIEVTHAYPLEVVQEWRDVHRHDDQPDRRQGVGFAATITTGRPSTPYGHNKLEVRA